MLLGLTLAHGPGVDADPAAPGPKEGARLPIPDATAERRRASIRLIRPTRHIDSAARLRSDAATGAFIGLTITTAA